MSGQTYEVLWLRPDGWEVAGDGFESREEAEEAAEEQLPEHVTWKVEPANEPVGE